MKNLNWPTVPKLIDGRWQDGAYWATDNGRYLDAFTDIGASPISNKLMATWLQHGLENGVALRKPHVVYDQLRDHDYPALLGEHLGIEDPRIFYTSGGSDAIETAMKLARKATGREIIWGLDGDFHGRSFANLSIQNPPVYHREGFYTERVPGMGCVHPEHIPAAPEVAAMVISPINGNNTLELWPSVVWQRAEAVQKAGGLIIFDEVQTGFGRGGGAVSIGESWDWKPPIKPDIWCFGKAAGAGWPHCPVITRGELGDVMGPGTHFNTMAGSPMGCYLSMRLIQWLVSDGITWMRGTRASLQLQFQSIYGYGYMMAIKTDDPYGLCARAQSAGLLLSTSRPDKPVRLAPPFALRYSELLDLKHLLAVAGVE